jgi:phosphatidate cytidylyltransferase
MSKKKSDLGPRLLTAAVAIPILIYIIFVAPPWALFALLLWAGATSVWEYGNMTFGPKNPRLRDLAAALGAALFAVMYWAPAHTIAMLCAAVLAVMLYVLFTWKELEAASRELAHAATGIVYGAVMIGTLGLLGRDTGTAAGFWVLMTLALVWSSDTGAYFTGRAFGKRKLYPSVSPNKSVEGAIGGFFSTILFAFGFNALFTSIAGSGYQANLFGLEFMSVNLTWTELNWWQILLLAIPANILGQTGDLAESLIKRAHGVKDSGTVIYGHGGILDRIDALIFAAPWVYYFYGQFVV